MVNWLGEITAQMYSEVEVKYQLAAKLPDRDGALHEVNLNVSGFIDLLCISDEGAQVYDFKTSKQKPTEKEVLASAQLALYLHLVEVGDLVDIDIATVAQSAGLVELRFPASTKAAHLPKVLELTAAQSSGDIEERLVAAAEVIYNEAYEARAGKHCEYCALKSMCPLKVEGKQVAQ
jgi:CRISPR/Cas system-associated exonuclease Cas4 (RecB family)